MIMASAINFTTAIKTLYTQHQQKNRKLIPLIWRVGRRKAVGMVISPTQKRMPASRQSKWSIPSAPLSPDGLHFHVYSVPSYRIEKRTFYHPLYAAHENRN